MDAKKLDIRSTRLIINTNRFVTDLSEKLQGFVSKFAMDSGLLHVFSCHTTLGLRIYELEPLLINDTCNKLEEFAPTNGKYGHDNIKIRDVPEDEPINGHSHLKSLLFNTSETIPVYQGKLQLGKWQRLAAFELDPSRTKRSIILTLNGYFLAEGGEWPNQL